MLVFFTNLSLMEFQVRYLALFLSNRQLWVVLDGNFSQECPVNTGVPHGSILGPTHFLLYINDLPDDVNCNITIYDDDTTLYSKCDLASDLWQQLASDLRDTADWGRKWCVDFNSGKTQLISFDRSNNTGDNDVKMNGSVLKEKSNIKMLWFILSSKLNWGYYIISIARTASKNWSFDSFYEVLSPEVALYLYKYKSIIRHCMEYYYQVWVGAPSCYLEF